MDNKEKPEDERKIVLGVDDEEAILDLLKFNIEKEGFKFLTQWIALKEFAKKKGKIDER